MSECKTVAQSDIAHLQWAHDRIVNVYGESENVDFLNRFRKILSALEGMQWQPIETAPRDGSTFLVRKVDPEITEYWSCWYHPPEKTFNGEVTECDGACWVLNDDVKQLIEGEDDHGYEWQPLPKGDK